MDRRSTPTEIEATVAAAIILNDFFMWLQIHRVVKASRLLPAGFHAHFIFGLARRPGIILHARCLLVAAYFATRLSLCRIIGTVKTRQHQQRHRKDSHDRSPLV
jgi:hypothetical protein